MGVAPLHFSQDIVVTTLKGNVKELAQLGQIRTGLHQPICEVARVAGGEADALDAGHVMHRSQQVGERPRPPPTGVCCHAREVAAICIDVLSEECDLLVTGFPQGEHLFANVLRLSTLLLTPGVRHHTVGALFITPINCIDPCGDGALTSRDRDVLQHLCRVNRQDLPGICPFQELHNTIRMLRPHDDVHLWHPPQHGLPLLLSHTACHHHLHLDIRVALALGLLAQSTVHLVLSLLTNGTRVIDQHIRLGGVLRTLIARGLQTARHALRVRHVHLAPKGVDMVQQPIQRDIRGGCSLENRAGCATKGIILLWLLGWLHRPLRDRACRAENCSSLHRRSCCRMKPTAKPAASAAFGLDWRSREPPPTTDLWASEHSW
mmetsp:Transcript_9142/g.16003  ORF Transcript_9142/g.16003 Transcript_9142/m.16003 type:complete len:377 (-) Transcript_9142:7-1137(-)